MCLQLYKDYHLVYSDCPLSESNHSTANNTLDKVNATNTTLYLTETAKDQSNVSIITNASIVLNETNITPNASQWVDNTTEKQVFASEECCACTNWTESTLSTPRQNVSANTTQTTALINYTTAAIRATNVYHGEWLVIILCLVLFVLFFIWRYAKFLRSENAHMKLSVIAVLKEKARRHRSSAFTGVAPDELTNKTPEGAVRSRPAPSAPPVEETTAQHFKGPKSKKYVCNSEET